jgi:hypothetical protein
MQSSAFSKLVRKYFDYLTDKFEFSITEERFYPESFGDAIVVFQSPTSFLTVTRERGDVLLEMGPMPNPGKKAYNLGEIIEFLAPDEWKGLKVFVFPDLPEKPEDSTEIQVRHLSSLVGQYAEPILRGNFSRWEDLEKFSNKKLKEFEANELPKLREAMRKKSARG